MEARLVSPLPALLFSAPSHLTGAVMGRLQGIASTPFLAGLARTLPVLTPGISPGELQAILQGGAASYAHQPTVSRAVAHVQPQQHQQTGASSATATQSGSATQAEAQAAHSSAGVEPGCASSPVPQAGEDAWAGLVDLTPVAKGNSTWTDNALYMHLAHSSPAGEAGEAGEQRWQEHEPEQAAQGPQLPSATWEALMQGGDASPDAAPPSVARPTPGVAKSAHKKRVSWGSTMEQVQLVPHPPAEGAAAPDQAATPVLGPAESVGSTSPATGSHPSPPVQVCSSLPHSFSLYHKESTCVNDCANVCLAVQEYGVNFICCSGGCSDVCVPASSVSSGTPPAGHTQPSQSAVKGSPMMRHVRAGRCGGPAADRAHRHAGGGPAAGWRAKSGVRRAPACAGAAQGHAAAARAQHPGLRARLQRHSRTWR